ncbi:MAG: hypothetical protein ABSF86_19990 [Steroidobacteraceae bacterium]|jgi:hypothetical protein
MPTNNPSACRCEQPPFNYQDFEKQVLGDDGYHAEVSVDRCKHCGKYWLNYLIEEEHFSQSGRWWRVVVPDVATGSIRAENARAFIERQADGFYGGSYFASTGRAFHGQTTIR